MKTLYLLGGQQRKMHLIKDEWHRTMRVPHHKKGLILRVNPETNISETCLEYVTPHDACAAKENPKILFTAASLQGKRLYVCTPTEVLIYKVPDFKRIDYISLPCFNDLHHVCPTKDGNLLIANTGLDMVVEITLEGKVLREWNVLGEDPWKRFSREVDYRKVLTTKPHRSHPNYVFQIGEDIWVTRFEQKDAVCLTRPDQRIEIGIERPHDGTIHGGFIYFTTVDGHLVIVNQNTLKIEEVIDLNKINESTMLLGWCRGLMVVDERKVWVGFSRIRPTKFRENISWAIRGFKHVRSYNTLPTHISCYDIVNKEHIKKIDVEVHGLNTIFSIVPVQEL